MNFLYNQGGTSIGKGEIDWVNDTIKLALLPSTHTPDQDNDQYYSDISGDEVSGTGYSAGGFTLTTTAITNDNTNNRSIFDADDVSESGLTISDYRYYAVYQSTGTPSTSRLIALIDRGSTGSLDNGTLDITWGAGGVFNLNN